MRRYSELFTRQTKLLKLDSSFDEAFESFEAATDEIIQKFNNNLELYSIKDKELDEKISENYLQYKSYETPEQKDLIDEFIYYESETFSTNLYLKSLMEMKIVYLFKTMEIIIKHFIKIAYPEITNRALYKWEDIKTFFKSRGIDISLLNGYSECIEIKKVNNSIKHNGIINEEMKCIPEFKGEEYIDYNHLERFYDRIKQYIKTFCVELREKIKDDLYIFNEDRLNQLTNEFYERMDDETIKIFTDKLRGKIH